MSISFCSRLASGTQAQVNVNTNVNTNANANGTHWYLSTYTSVFIDRKSPKMPNATFGRIKPIVLGFDPLSHLIRTNPRTIGLIRSKVAVSNFHIFSTDSTFGKSRRLNKQRPNAKETREAKMCSCFPSTGWWGLV